MPLLNRDLDRIKTMECDLAQKMKQCFSETPDLHINVHDVFSLDDLEEKRAADLCNGVAVGIGFVEAMPVVDPKADPGSVNRGPRGAMIDYRFVAVFAIPTVGACGERHDATKLMTVAMDSILGSAVDGDTIQRCWEFVGQKSETGASTKEVLYYSQVWQIRLPVGKTSS